MSNPAIPGHLEPLQGSWKVQSSRGCQHNTLPRESWITEQGACLVIEGNHIHHNGQPVVALGQEVDYAMENKLGSGNGRLLTLILPDGRELLCKYRVFDAVKEIQIIYPYNACTRSGHVVYLERHEA